MIQFLRVFLVPACWRPTFIRSLASLLAILGWNRDLDNLTANIQAFIYREAVWCFHQRRMNGSWYGSRQTWFLSTLVAQNNLRCACRIFPLRDTSKKGKRMSKPSVTHLTSARWAADSLWYRGTLGCREDSGLRLAWKGESISLHAGEGSLGS